MIPLPPRFRRLLSLLTFISAAILLSCFFPSDNAILHRPWIARPQSLESCKTTPLAAAAAVGSSSRGNVTITLKEHRYRRDGLVEVNEEGAHPIYELMRHAEGAWKDKLKRASTTLAEAIKEYKRRYHRAPPRGFDLW